jgi:hypothetical protein
MLAFGAAFYLDCSVSAAPDEVTATTATGVSGQHGGAAFTTTHWSVVLEAQGESPAAQEALEKLCRTYWRPSARGLTLGENRTARRAEAVSTTFEL